MNVRFATIADVDSIALIHVVSWQHAYRGILSEEFLATLSIDTRRARWIEAIGNGPPHVLVVEDASEVIGFCDFGSCRDSDSAPGDFEIWSIYLAPGHWSKGAGRALWLAARDELIARGATTIRLWVLRDNHRAIRFYAAAGFQPEPDRTNVLQIGGTEILEMRYSQSLLAR